MRKVFRKIKNITHKIKKNAKVMRKVFRKIKNCKLK